MEVLLAHRADVNAPYTKMNSENTPLHLAAVRGYANLVSLLLTNGANANPANNDGSTPLHLAVMQGQGGVVQMLLQAGADPNVEDQRGRTPLSYAAERGSAEIVRSLLAAKADPAGGKLDAPLLLAINKHDPVSAELLLKAGANPNLKGKVHWQVNFGNTSYPSGAPVTPMFLACTAKQLPLVQLLLKFKADPNDSQTDNRSPLFWVLDRPDIVRALLDAGARAEATETITFHPRGAMETFHETLLQEAANQNQAETVELLLQHGANPDVCEERGNSALHYAAFALADEKVFTLLLEHKVSPNVRNDEGRTPLDVVKEALQSSWGGRFDNLTIRKAQVEKLIALLHQRGALDNLPNWDRITVSRPSDKYSAAVFWKGTNDWNRFTLFEALLNFYSPPSHRGGLNYAILLPYPDLRRVTILRHKPNTTNEARIKVDLLNSTNGIDCARNVPLEFGDVVEVPEREHALGVRPVGLTASQNDVMVDFLKGKVRLAAGGENVELPVYPDNSSLIGSVLARPEARGVLLSSSDLSRVKVTRRDPRTGRTLDWTLNCSGDNAPDLWLRDGDVMEVPQR